MRYLFNFNEDCYTNVTIYEVPNKISVISLNPLVLKITILI